ncbi:DUF72 domain-containing protein [Microbispora triticiradicis]|uniref:DUF72 domain-containing protein n=1 Tax=Microbispora triticiradicis TaxID=2200763 RepID=UPI001AD7706B|nr:DUF72 domain-containing protein [Microbispora triticiradicis]MBO4271595.1 DUF72 domain-containing protein [Microbispora triticiradicis]
MPVLVGTSGWQYADWRDLVYGGVPQRLWLERYGEIFATVENNNAFYRLPKRETFESWRERTPPDFVMAVKASRFLTHIKRLKDPEEPVDRLMGVAEGLGPKLGPILLQLPPTLQADAVRLRACLARFPSSVRVAVEPRHASWWTDEIRDLLTEFGAALCWADRLGRPAGPLWRTTSWVYLRFHEGRAAPWPAYGRRALHSWADRLGDVPDAYVYFNNDPGGAAVRNAVTFAEIVRARGREVTRVRPPAGLGGEAPRLQPAPS